MDSVWAPWRMEYIEKEKEDECIFCVLPQAQDDEKNYILYRGPLCFVIMNTFPYNNGHLMVTPYRHLNCLTLLTKEESAEMGQLIRKCIERLKKLYSPDGFNTGTNLGKAGGAGFDQHLHTHIVPRWIGDTNFMPVLAETKVHPQHLRAGYEKLAPLFNEQTL
ncbi:MAG: HIT domain-containing protein [Nitrospinota bacterium]|nr:HIT domain-containing protein [Nitrospinota bacterium]